MYIHIALVELLSDLVVHLIKFIQSTQNDQQNPCCTRKSDLNVVEKIVKLK